MSDRAHEWIAKARNFLRMCAEPHRRAAFVALIKASLLLGALSEMGWLLNTRFFSRRFAQPPISLAWSILTMIFLVTAAQVSCSIALKLRGARRDQLSTAARLRLTALLADYLSGEKRDEQIELAAKDAPEDLEKCIAKALLGLRGSALRRLRELSVVTEIRDRWIVQSRKGDVEQRRDAVERLALLRDPASISALERAINDPVGTVQAAAIRGILHMHSHGTRAEVIRSLPERPYLVRVLTACESPAEIPAPGEVDSLVNLARAIGAVSAEPAKARTIYHALAVQGVTGFDSLRRMSAAGEGGDAPAEALSASLAAAARGGRT